MSPRLFCIEPGLARIDGHPIQYARVLGRYCLETGVELYTVCRRDADANVLRAVTRPVPLLDAHCFPLQGESVELCHEALKMLDAEFTLGGGDLLYFASAHANEMRAATRFVKDSMWLTRLRPKVAMTVHQLVPPLARMNDIDSPTVERTWRPVLMEALKELPGEAISLWSTDCVELASTLSAASSLSVGMLPFLFVGHEVSQAVRKDQAISIAFLGDGRAEKGLHVLLEALHSDAQKWDGCQVVIQYLRPRGYDEPVRERLESLLDALRRAYRLKLIERPLDPDEFSTILRETDVVVTPYDARYYNARASLLHVQAVAAGCIVIASGESSVGRELTANGCGGLTFACDCRDPKGSAVTLSVALESISADLDGWRRRLGALRQRYLARHTPSNFMESLRSGTGWGRNMTHRP